jgi:bacterioferritin-associated ferredoxin
LVLIFILKKGTLRAMIVCHCRQVTDRQIRKLVRHGASSCREIARACGAGAASRCGSCRPAVAQVIEEELASSCSMAGHAAGGLPEPLPAS